MTTTLRFPFGKTLPAVCLLAASFFSASAQTVTKRNCFADDILQKELAADPARAERLQTIEAHTSRFLKSNQANAATGVITIPVVVHVLYNNSTENISEAQINSQIQVMNDDFRRQNADRDNTWSQAADMEIEFALATVDPNGNATTGITRTYTSTTSFSANNNNMKYSSQGGKNAWPRDSYLNMWVCDLGGGILGFAQFPGGAAATDGVVMGYKYFGTTGAATAPFDGGRTTTHEVGHWLNLRHIWGDGACGVDDFVSDTPASDAANYGCSVGHVSCGSTDMVQNYMDYSDDACMNLFTAGQKSRMRALFSAGGAREALLSSGGLGGGSTPPPSACADTEVNFQLVLDNYPSETSWSLKNSSGATVASGNGYSNANSTVNETFCLTDGSYTFTINDSYGDGICCSYGNGSYTISESGSVLASGGSFADSETKTFTIGGGSTPPPASCPTLNFNDYSFSGYSNQDNGSYTIQDGGTTVVLSGNAWKAIPFNYTITANTVIEFDFGSTREGEIQGISFENDNSISSNRTFKLFGTQNWGISNYDNYPANNSWKSYTIPVGQFFTGSINKLVFVGDDDASSAQNAYFRNVKIYEGSCGSTRSSELVADAARIMNEGEEALFNISLYPNPNRSGELKVRLNSGEAMDAAIYDMTGRRVWSEQLEGDGREVKIDIRELADGLYTLKATDSNGHSLSSKFVKQ